ncbi:MAG: hotdog fold thioesterase [Proteobacteria bacterium]|nr:hotdog fold thioesterase [Pseudomonadota bacterium]
MKVEYYGYCWICGEKNPGGFQLKFDLNKNERTMRTSFIPTETYQGYDGIVHGGILSALLDEAMAKLAFELGYNAVTAMLKIRFKSPARVKEKLVVRGEIIDVNRRLVLAKATIHREDGTLIAEGDSKLVRR